MVRSRIRAVLAACLAFGAVAPQRVEAAQTGASAVTTLTPEQRAELRARLAELLRQDAEGLISESRADGALSISLDGRYQHAIVARPRGAGRPELACFDDPDAAVAFLARDSRRAAPAAPVARQPAPEERDR